MKKILHIFWLKPSDTGLREMVTHISRRRTHNCRIVASEEQIRSTLSMLPSDAKIMIWLHLDKEDKDNGGEPRSLGAVSDFNRSGVINSKFSAYFFTRGTISYLESGNWVHNPVIKEHNGELIFSQKIFEPEYESLLFSYARTARELRSPEFMKIKPNQLVYPNEDWNWRITQLKSKVSDEVMSAILGTVFDLEYEKYSVEIIKGGFSGAIVLSVTVRDGNKSFYYLLKISEDGEEINKEYQRTLKRYFQRLDNKIFIGAYPDGYKEVLGWYCIIFPFVSEKKTLRGYLKKNLLNSKNGKLIKAIFSKFSEFEKNGYNLFSYDTLPFKGNTIELNFKRIHYDGLDILGNKRFRILETIDLMQERFLSNLETDCTNLKEQIDNLTQFLLSEKGFYKGKSIQEFSSKKGTPISIVHGDLHTANILVDEKGENIAFIDFANVPDKPTKHKFLDIGKFSSDLEISIFPEKKLLENNDILMDWIKAHKAWLNRKNIKSEFREVEAVYALNSVIRDTILPTKIPKGMTDAFEAERQFQMVRLHYFLKAISYNHEIREKILFFIRASIDILEFLITPPEGEK